MMGNNYYYNIQHNRRLYIMSILYIRKKRREKARQQARQKKRRWWVCPTISLRSQYGAWEHLVQELSLNEPHKYLNYHRMTVEQFNFLLEKVQPNIQRRSVVRDPIPAGLKLSLTLRYLSAGDSMISLSYAYRIGKSTTSSIISETCEAIWQALQPEFLAPPTAEGWKKIAEEFHELWNFPNCVGAIDGKHVIVQNFKNSGSQFFNYKGSFSIVLLACCDAKYRFTLLSIGSAGRESDGGIFQSSDFGQIIIRNRLPLPEETTFNGFHTPFSASFVADAAFPLLHNLMRPYAGNNLPPAETIYNYRHSRARRVIENAFGVLSARFRIFRKPIYACSNTVNKIVQACCVLHNWLRTMDIIDNNGAQRYMPPDFVDKEDKGIFRPGQWRQDDNPNGMVAMPGTFARNGNCTAKVKRDHLRDYFMTSGQVLWQWNKLPNF